MTEDRFDVRVSPVVAPLLREAKENNASRPQSAEAMLYRAIKAAVEGVLSDPVHCADAKHQLRGDLAGICRLKIGYASRYRVFFIYSTEHRQTRLLWVGYRRAGDRRDAYEEFARRLANGEFDDQFRELGKKRPGS